MNRSFSKKILGIIPARYASQRFPGKPLASLAGKTLLQITYENALRAGCFDALLIATDDARIYNHILSFGGKTVMTPPSCNSGTERIVHVLKNDRQWDEYSLIVNIQGDEPCVSPESFHTVIHTLGIAQEAVISTLITPIKDLEQLKNPSIVKCVRDRQGYALYFSRSPIPGAKTPATGLHSPHYRHIGIYAYRRDFLLLYPQLENTPLQLAEDLEQLKVLEHGYRIATACVDEQAIGVDTPEDLVLMEQFICTVNTSLSQAESVPL